MTNSCDYLLRADYVLTLNERRELIEKGAIAVAGSGIAAVGPRAEVESEWRGRSEIDLGESLLMPGLINAHTHSPMTFLRGLADDSPLLDWLRNTVFPIEARLNREIVELGALLGYAEMLATGTTACVDMYMFADAVFAAARQAGIRCLGGEAVFSFPSAACAGPDEALDVTRDLADKYAGDPLISVAVNPHSVYTADARVLRASADLARERELPLHIHLAETKDETRLCVERNGARPVAWAAEQGVFETRALAAHLVDIDATEAAFLASRGAVAIHNPGSNMKLASGVAPVPALLDAGVAVALGTDGPASNNTLNMFAEMNRAALLHKLASGKAETLPAAKVIELATLGGARALGDPSLGSLETGKTADIIAIALDKPNTRPFYQAESQLVYAASGHECRLTMVGGEIRYRDGEYAFDYEGLIKEIDRLRKFALGRSA